MLLQKKWVAIAAGTISLLVTAGTANAFTVKGHISSPSPAISTIRPVAAPSPEPMADPSPAIDTSTITRVVGK